jgi:hypothetical protein
LFPEFRNFAFLISAIFDFADFQFLENLIFDFDLARRLHRYATKIWRLIPTHRCAACRTATHSDSIRPAICAVDDLSSHLEDTIGSIVLGLVDLRRNRPHPHQISREGPHQLTRVGFLAKQRASSPLLRVSSSIP